MVHATALCIATALLASGCYVNREATCNNKFQNKNASMLNVCQQGNGACNGIVHSNGIVKKTAVLLKEFAHNHRKPQISHGLYASACVVNGCVLSNHTIIATPKATARDVLPCAKKPPRQNM